MTTTLQQALLQAGLLKNKNRLPAEPSKKSTLLKSSVREETIQKTPVQPSRSVSSVKAKETETLHEHHRLRTGCENCRKSGPDVEYYEHRNRSLSARWLCVKCADSHNIPDEFRQTRQSQFAKSGRFRREYGATKVFR